MTGSNASFFGLECDSYSKSTRILWISRLANSWCVLEVHFVFRPLHSYCKGITLNVSARAKKKKTRKKKLNRKTHDYNEEVFQSSPHESTPFDDSNIVLVGARPMRHYIHMANIWWWAQGTSSCLLFTPTLHSYPWIEAPNMHSTYHQ